MANGSSVLQTQTGQSFQVESKIVEISSSSSTTSFKSTSSASSVGGGAGLNKFKQMDQQAKAKLVCHVMPDKILLSLILFPPLSFFHARIV